MIDGHDAQVRLVIDWLAGFSSHRSRQNKNLNGYEKVELGQDKQLTVTLIETVQFWRSTAIMRKHAYYLTRSPDSEFSNYIGAVKNQIWTAMDRLN